MKQIVNACGGLLFFTYRAVVNVGQSIMTLLGPASGWTGMKRWLLQITTLGMLAGGGGFLVAALGLVPIKASSGHWPITAWFLHFTMGRSVSTHTIGMKVPALDKPGMVLKGATHFETGCFPCHGNPSIPNPRIPMEMTPHPPYLPPIVGQWGPEELYYIVKHGVKFTGMPAWPAQQRDDEVWAMVAFLQKFPELNEQEYRSMVSGVSEMSGDDAPIQALSGRKVATQSISDGCNRCHGLLGQGRGEGVAPKLAGQKPEYLEASLKAFSQGKRHSGIMEPIGVGLSREETREVAKYYSELASPQLPRRPTESELAISRGATIAREGVPKARVPICVRCHGPGDNPRNSAYPNLAGQYADYLIQQLELFAYDYRGGSEFAALMHQVAERMTPQQMRDVALYYESLAVPNVPMTSNDAAGKIK